MTSGTTTAGDPALRSQGGDAMRTRHRFAWTAAAGLLAAVPLAGCELALHEVQQASGGGCDSWQPGCPPLVEYAGPPPAAPEGANLDRLGIVGTTMRAPQRRCDGVGLVCQGRIIGDVLWDQYIMVLAGQSPATPTAANTLRVVPAATGAPAAKPPPQATPGPVVTPPPRASGTIARTHGSRADEAATTAPR